MSLYIQYNTITQDLSLAEKSFSVRPGANVQGSPEWNEISAQTRGKYILRLGLPASGMVRNYLRMYQALQPTVFMCRLVCLYIFSF